MKERFWRPIPKAERHDCNLKPLSKTAQDILRHEPQVREQDGMWAKIEAENDQDILECTILQLRYVIGDVNTKRQTR